MKTLIDGGIWVIFMDTNELQMDQKNYQIN
jgi:hypothetical protein